MLTFKECTLIKLDKTFGLEQIRHSHILQAWLEGHADISERERDNLADLQELLAENVDNWNEQELALHFIGPLFSFVNFTGKKFNIFAERLLSGVVDGIEMSGRPDGMIASGHREPEKPYFCFQEYKKEKDAEGDPAAQVLAAMLVAEEINERKIPVYGCYVRGRFWFFMVLQDRQYCLSDAFVATRNDVFDIFRILKVLKQIIIKIIDDDKDELEKR